MLIYAWSCTDVGMKRKENQDSALLAHDLKLFAVADGMGGHKGGEVASMLAVKTLEQHVRAKGELAEGIVRANEVIHRAAREDVNLHQMGTTTSSVLFRGHEALIAHVGDSRVYLIRGGRILQITEDHSVVFQQVKAGLMTPEQARSSPYRNVIMRSVGIEQHVEVDLISLRVESGDALIICSDGLSNHVGDDEILEIVRENFLHRVPEILVDLANARGGTDNITVVAACALKEPLTCTCAESG
jgi:PPM family protein phosphatase